MGSKLFVSNATNAAQQYHYGNSIATFNGYDKNAITYIPVVIIGAGESGIAMGCRLKQKLGFDQFRIFDRQAGVGGTWWINRYPGVACDVPALFYSFSFAPNPRWTALYPPGPEIVKYLHDVCNKFAITDKIQCNTDIEGCRWLEDEQIWEVYLRHMVPGAGDLSNKERNQKIESDGPQSVYLKRETIRAKVIASAVGGLVEPNAFPKIPGAESFEGELFHSARWRDDVDFNDKNVVVLGTGCSAAQVVPELVKPKFNAKHVTQLMRSPPWVVPKIRPPGGNEAYQKWAPAIQTNIPGLAWVLRKVMFAGGEWDFRLFGMSDFCAKERVKYEKWCMKYLKKHVPKEYWETLTPDYSVGCKRRIFDATWFPSLQNPKIDITTQPLTEMRPHSVVVGPGQSYPQKSADEFPEQREIPADVLVLANGFEVTHWLHPLKVIGKEGKDLVEEMDARGGPQAYQGTAMDGFPNFFLIFGPNTATGHSSVILASENMVEYSLQFIKLILDGDVRTVDVKREAEMAYTADIQRSLKGTVFNSGGCHSWYTHGDWNATVYPYTQIWFGIRCLFPFWRDWNIDYTTKGRVKLAASRTVRFASVVLTFLLAYNARQSGQGLSYFRNLPLQLLAYGIQAKQRIMSQ